MDMTVLPTFRMVAPQRRRRPVWGPSTAIDIELPALSRVPGERLGVFLRLHVRERKGNVEFTPVDCGVLMAGVKRVVDGTSEAARSVAAAIVGVGDGLAGGVVGGVAGAVNGISGGLGMARNVAPSATVAAAGITAGVLGLVDWPLLVLAGGTALVVRQLRGAPAGSTRTAVVPGRRAVPAKKASTPPKKTAAPARTTTARKRASASERPGTQA